MTQTTGGANEHVLAADGTFDVHDQPVDLKIYRFEDWIALALFWLLAGVVFLQFFTRYALNDSASWTEEIARYLLICTVFVGAAIAVRKNNHVQVDFLYRVLPRPLTRGLATLVDLVRVAFFAYAVYLTAAVVRLHNGPDATWDKATYDKLQALKSSHRVVPKARAGCVDRSTRRFGALVRASEPGSWDRQPSAEARCRPAGILPGPVPTNLRSTIPGGFMDDAKTTVRDAREELDSLNPARELTRRGFVKTSLAAGFAAAVTPVAAQTMITTDTQGLMAGEVKIPTKDGDMPAYRAMPAGKSGLATVLVVQEIFGVHEHIKDVCRRLAKQGYLAVAPELYARQGDPAKYTDIPKLVAELVSKVADAQVMADLDATAAWAANNGAAAGKLGITGFCWGGRIVWMYAAHNPQLTAGVAWYGPVARAYHAGDKTPLDVVARIKAPILGLYGGADAGIPNDTVEKMREALQAAGNRKCEIVIYPNMPHAFHADYRPSYRKEAAEDGWKRLLAWFKQHGVA